MEERHFCLSRFITHRNRFSFTKITQVLGPYFTMTQSTKGSPGGKTHRFHSNHDWTPITIAISPLGAAPSALWD